MVKPNKVQMDDDFTQAIQVWMQTEIDIHLRIYIAYIRMYVCNYIYMVIYIPIQHIL